MRKIFLSTAVGFFFFVSSVFATIIRVPQDQPTIQAGINAAVNGDTVLVAPGTYNGSVTINGKNIQLLSSSEPQATIINGSVSFANTDSYSTLEGFTVQNVQTGISLSNSSALIQNNIVQNNAGGLGAGLFSSGGGSPKVIGNIFKGNGGGGRTVEFVDDINPVLERNLIVENFTDIAVFVHGPIIARNNTIARNSSQRLAFYWGARPAGQITNNIISNNSQYGIDGAADSVLITYNNFFGNTNGSISSGMLGVGNITADPLFIGGNPFDYHLQGASPCIDAGDPVTPVPSGGGPRVDIGAYENLTSLLLVIPNNFANLNAQRPQFVWRRLRDSSGIVSSSYQVLLATEMNFLTPDSSPTLTDTSWKVPSKLTFGQTYFWKVTAFTDSGDTILSQIRLFNIPLPFETILPMDGPLRRPTFIWHGMNDTSITDSFKNFQAILAKDCEFQNADTSSVLADTMWKVPHMLSFGHLYCWKVFSVSDSGDTAISDIHSFYVQLPVITKLYPGNYETIQLRQPTFTWQPLVDTTISGPIKYRVFLNNNYATEETSAVIIDTVWKIPHKLELNQNYFWALLVSYENEPWDTLDTGPHYFTTLLPIVSLSQPANFSRIGDKRPNFMWQALSDTSIPDTFFYRLTYAKNPSFTNVSTSPILADNFWQVPAPLDIATTYYWKVLAFYSSTNDTVFPYENFNFLLAPTRIDVPDDRPTIQQAIDISLNGDTVMVEPGVYQQNIFFSGKRIKLLSEGGSENTTIAKLVDGAPLVNFSGSEDSNTVLRGFTLKGARLVPNGAAINVASASPIIENNYFQDNQGDSAVIYVLGGSPKIRRNLIVNNNTNLAAIGFFGGPGGEIINNTVANNIGDGVRIRPAMIMQIKNNILSFNSGYGIRSVGGINNSSTVSYNDIFSNTQGTYFATIPTTGDIFQNPQFRDGNPFDYHLLLGSPCINAGDPAFPVPPGGGSRIDMGAFEFVATKGDLNGDGMYSPADVVLELNCVFLGVGNCPLAMADMNCDSQLTPADVVLILNFVFLGNPPPC